MRIRHVLHPELTQQRTALGNRFGGPRRERRLCGGDRLVKLHAISSGRLATTSSVAGLMTSSLAAPDTNSPLISSLNSLVALSSLRDVAAMDALPQEFTIPHTCDGTKLGTDLSDLGVADTDRILHQPEQILHGQSAHLRAANPAQALFAKVSYATADPTPKNNGRFATDDHLFGKRSCPTTVVEAF